MSILDQIVHEKRKEISFRKGRMPMAALEKWAYQPIRNFKSALQGEKISIIAEIKRMSPTAGLIRKIFEPVSIAQIYEKHGASAISILTDYQFFGGSNTYLSMVKQEVTIPVLRKEFIIDEYQIAESRYLGADAILLIAALLENHVLKTFLEKTKHLGLAALVEVHTEEELERILSLPVEIVGINNRNLETFEVNLSTSLKLRSKIPAGIVTVSESGIHKRDDVYKLKEAGFDGVLVGESLMRAEDIGEALDNLLISCD